MYSVFSERIVERWKLLFKAKYRRDVPPNITLRVHDVLIWFAKNNKVDCLGDEVLTCNILPTLSYVAEEAKYKPCVTPELRKLNHWINENLVACIPTDSAKTKEVKLRIAVGMLNNLEKKGIITKDLSLFYFDNIITNVQDLWWECIDSDLPF